MSNYDRRVRIRLENDSLLSLPVAAGKKSNCPFCLGRRTDKPPVGTELLLLNKYNAGLACKVVSHDSPIPSIPWSFLVHIEDQPEDHSTVVHGVADLYLETDYLNEIPSFVPPFNWQDCQRLDDIVVGFGMNCSRLGKWVWSKHALWGMVHLTWSRRLPVTGKEVAELCAAHGFPEPWRKRISRDFDYCYEFLGNTMGRLPIKKKRFD